MWRNGNATVPKISHDSGRPRQLFCCYTEAPFRLLFCWASLHHYSHQWRSLSQEYNDLIVLFNSTGHNMGGNSFEEVFTLWWECEQKQNETDIISSYLRQLFSRHHVEQVLTSVCYCDTTFLLRQWCDGFLKLTDSILFEQRDKSSPLNFTQYAVLPGNIEMVIKCRLLWLLSLHPTYNACCLIVNLMLEFSYLSLLCRRLTTLIALTAV